MVHRRPRSKPATHPQPTVSVTTERREVVIEMPVLKYTLTFVGDGSGTQSSYLVPLGHDNAQHPPCVADVILKAPEGVTEFDTLTLFVVDMPAQTPAAVIDQQMLCAGQTKLTLVAENTWSSPVGKGSWPFTLDLSGFTHPALCLVITNAAGEPVTFKGRLEGQVLIAY